MKRTHTHARVHTHAPHKTRTADFRYKGSVQSVSEHVKFLHPSALTTEYSLNGSPISWTTTWSTHPLRASTQLIWQNFDQKMLLWTSIYRMVKQSVHYMTIATQTS